MVLTCLSWTHSNWANAADWYIFVDRSVYVPRQNRGVGMFVSVWQRLTLKQYIIVARGAAKIDVRFVSTKRISHGEHHNHAHLDINICRWRQKPSADQDGNDPFLKVHCLSFVYGWVHASGSRSKSQEDARSPETCYRKLLLLIA